jgi:hypothetical protein
MSYLLPRNAVTSTSWPVVTCLNAAVISFSGAVVKKRARSVSWPESTAAGEVRVNGAGHETARRRDLFDRLPALETPVRFQLAIV